VTASEALFAWLEHLAHERRLSPRTLEAYGHIGRTYLAFLEQHRGEPQSLADLGTITAAEVRALPGVSLKIAESDLESL